MNYRSLLLLGSVLYVGTLSAVAPVSPKKEEAPKEVKSVSPDLVTRGKKIFRSHCVQCHNADPRKDGAQGPSNWGSSLELLSLKVTQGTYPKGYKPKRTTRNMTRMPHLAKEIEALHAYLNSPIQ